MKKSRLLISLAVVAAPVLCGAQQPQIARKDVLDVEIQPFGKLSKVTAQEITFTAGAKASAHLDRTP